MSQLPSGAYITSINGKRCTALPGQPMMRVNYNISMDCGSSQSFALLDDTPKPSTFAVPQTRIGVPLIIPSASVVVAEDQMQSPQISNSSHSSSTSPTNRPNPATSSSPARPVSSSASSTSAVVIISSTSTQNALQTSVSVASTFTSTSTSTSSVATSTQQTAIINPSTQTRPQIPQPVGGNSPQAPQPTENNIPQINSPTDQKPGADRSSAPKAPAQEAVDTKKPIETTPAGNQPAPSNQIPGSPSSSTPGDGLNSPTPQPTPPTASPQPDPIASDTVRGPGPKLSSVAVVAPARPTTLETATNSLSPTTQNTAGGSSIVDSFPTGTATNPFGDTPDTTPIGFLPGGTGRTNPGVGAADLTSSGKMHLSTGAIVGMSVGGIAAITLISLLIWLWRRRLAKKQAGPLHSPTTASNTGSGTRGMDAPAMGKFRMSHWLSRTGRNEHDPNSLTYSNMAAVAPSMSERRVAPGYRPGLMARDGISKQQPTQLRYDGHARGKSLNETSMPKFGLDQSQVGSLDPFSDRNAADFPPQLPSLPSTALLFELPGENYSTHLSGASQANPRRLSRGRSLSATVRASQNPIAQTSVSRPHSIHRESVASVSSFTNKRNKFRSDPFDLEIKSRLLSSQDSIPEMPRHTAASSTYSAHPESVSSSRYTSGVSVSDWSLLNADGATEPRARAPASNVVSWDNPKVPDSVRPGDRTRPLNIKKQPEVVVGQAL